MTTVETDTRPESADGSPNSAERRAKGRDMMRARMTMIALQITAKTACVPRNRKSVGIVTAHTIRTTIHF